MNPIKKIRYLNGDLLSFSVKEKDLIKEVDHPRFTFPTIQQLILFSSS
ncbi:hypothetical protein [Sphingobacterium populi]|nr:hypothetical protein [Sphingobacterium sp. CFCC 11742]